MRMGLSIQTTATQSASHLQAEVRQWLESLGLDAQRFACVSSGAESVHVQLAPDAAIHWLADFNTLHLASAQGWNGADDDTDLLQEILWSLLASPSVQTFPSLQEFQSACRIRLQLVRAAQRTSMDFKTDEVDRPAEHWQYHPDTGFTLRPGKCLIEALTLATQPASSGRKYAFSCYRATEYVVLLALAQEARDHNPDLYARLEHQWRTRAIMAGDFQETLLRELGSQEQPLPMHWYVPGDRVWFRNPDDASSDVYGYEGSWVVYLGGGLFTNFWQKDRPYDIAAKCLEIYHWRDGVVRDAQGKLAMDESAVSAQVEQTRACPVRTREVLERMQRLRDPAGVYAHGGCMDASREVARWMRPGTCDIVLPDA